ncbi:MAG TPA: polyphosphate kinase 1, partial [Oligoflexia bacterium]|nr:polyphosphate kinase 1 [Oligoflexia bacterium]
KTHAKTILVVREEPDGIRTYCHIGTGNYHATTARLYTDLGLFTASSDYTEELAHFFNYLTGRSAKTDYQTLLVAPINMRERFYKMIKREIEHQQAGRPAHIVAKVNSLSDEGICEALYRASEKGVPVELIVRGLCCLRAQQPGLSDNIRVTSVVGRLLEHSRIFYFRNGADSPLDGEFYLGSADWMKRNLDHRVEIAAPIKTTLLREKCWEILDIIRHDETQAWDMQSDGSYRRRCGGNLSLGTHEFLMQKTKKNTRSGQRRKAKPPED